MAKAFDKVRNEGAIHKVKRKEILGNLCSLFHQVLKKIKKQKSNF